jgi:micrococcal nuclease
MRIAKKKIFVALIVIAALFLVYFLFMQSPSEPSKCRGEARCFYGMIEKAVDGDTLEISGETVRLALINTPEKQAGGYDAARQFVERMCPIGSDVVVDEDDLQISRSHRRIIAVVHCGSKNLNEELLKAGYAKILEDFCERSEFADDKWARLYGCG